MNDDPKRAFREAEQWLVSAKHTLVEAQDDEALCNVCCAQAIHCIIRANDALSLKFLNVKATRHDDAPTLFARLMREEKVSASDQDLKNIVSRAMRDKSGADYGKAVFLYDDARWYAEKAEEFLNRVKSYLD